MRLENVDIGIDRLGVGLELGQTNVQFLGRVAFPVDDGLDSVNLNLLVLDIDIEVVVVVHERGDINLDLVSVTDEDINIGLKIREVSLARLPLSVDDSDTLIKAHQRIVERRREILDNDEIFLQGVRAHLGPSHVDIDRCGLGD